MIRKWLWALERCLTPYPYTRYLFIPSPPAMFPVAAIVPVAIEDEFRLMLRVLRAEV